MEDKKVQDSAEVTETPEELNPFETTKEKLKSCEYLIRVLFNTDFITAETTTKKEVFEKISKLKAEISASEEFGLEELLELNKYVAKLECLMSAFEYLRENNLSAKEKVLKSGGEAGWTLLEKEDWKIEYVQKSQNCGRFQAIKALEETKDLAEACKIAPKLVAEFPKFGKAPPPKDLMATLSRNKKKFD